MWKNEELIYTNTVDVSKESGIPNNKVYTRVVKRTEIKPKNLFRWTEKIIVYLDVECKGADLLGSYQSHGILSDEIWKAKNFALSYKIDEPYTHKEIRIIKKWS